MGWLLPESLSLGALYHCILPFCYVDVNWILVNWISVFILGFY